MTPYGKSCILGTKMQNVGDREVITFHPKVCATERDSAVDEGLLCFRVLTISAKEPTTLHKKTIILTKLLTFFYLSALILSF